MFVDDERNSMRLDRNSEGQLRVNNNPVREWDSFDPATGQYHTKYTTGAPGVTGTVPIDMRAALKAWLTAPGKPTYHNCGRFSKTF